MTLDQRALNSTSTFGAVPRKSVGPIGVPQDMTPRIEILNKNASGFMASLMSGDGFGYAHIQGGAKDKNYNSIHNSPQKQIK